MSKRFAIFLLGLVWLAGGYRLLIKGLWLFLSFLKSEAVVAENLLALQRQALFFIGVALLVGFIKGRFVLVKAVQRSCAHILSAEGNIGPLQLVDKKSLLVIGSMVLLGVCMNLLPIRPTIRGFVDIAIGSALIHGSLLFFRAAICIKGSSTS